MTLVADYQSRFSTQLRTTWSNAQTSSATTPNTTFETLIGTEVEAEFAIETGVAYSSSLQTHVAVGVPLLQAKLMYYTGIADFSFYEKALERVRQARLVLGRDRIMPTTDSTKTESADPAGARVFADAPNFSGYVPNSPQTTSTSTPSDQFI